MGGLDAATLAAVKDAYDAEVLSLDLALARFFGELELEGRTLRTVHIPGVVLPNVTDGFSGKAPDLGACELGHSPPHYGPRKEWQASPAALR